MLKIKYHLYLLSLILFFSSLSVHAQTSHWRLIWDKNAAEDTVTYYVVYKHAGAAPTSNDSIARVNHPTSLAQDSVVYTDTHLNTGILYYYRVVAVDYIRRRSDFSDLVFEAIPTIINFPDTLKLPRDTTAVINLNSKVSDLDDQSNTLSWFVNGQKSYQNVSASLRININTSNQATFITNPSWSDMVTLNFSVIDPDSFYNTRSLVIAQGTFSQDTTDTTGTEEQAVYAFPVPFITGEHDQITITKIPNNATLVIYNFMGESVFYNENITGGEKKWNVRNMAGKKINSGLYIYIVKDKSGNKLASGKLVIIR